MTTTKIKRIKVIGELKQWQRKPGLRGNPNPRIEGMLEDVLVTFHLKYDLVHYPKSKESQEHYLARTTLGDYYLLNSSEEKL